MDKSARIFVAGHTGLIGSAVCRALSYRGHSSIITRSSKLLDLRNQAAVDRFLKKQRPQYVVLAAGRVGGILENKTYPAEFILDNLSIQLNVLKAAAELGVKRLIFFGSSCMYPTEAVQPMAESALLTGKPESTSLSYAVAKFAGLQMCLALNQQLGRSVFIPLIPNSTYGPFDNFDSTSSHVLSALIRRFVDARRQGLPSVKLWGSGRVRREFIYSDDVAEACLMFLEKDILPSSLPINIGCGNDITIAELADKIAAIVGYGGTIEWDLERPDGAPRKLLDTSRISAIGWSPKIDLSTGLTKTYHWYLANQDTVLESS